MLKMLNKQCGLLLSHLFTKTIKNQEEFCSNTIHKTIYIRVLTKALLSPVNGPFLTEVTKAIFQSILYQQKALLLVNVLFIFNIFWLIPLTPYFKNSTTLTKFYFIIFFFFYVLYIYIYIYIYIYMYILSSFFLYQRTFRRQNRIFSLHNRSLHVSLLLIFKQFEQERTHSEKTKSFCKSCYNICINWKSA